MPSTPPDDPKVPSKQRRDLLLAGAAAAGASLLASCMGGGASEEAPLVGEPPPDPLARFSHLVVVMFENRSFDNLLGYLYSQGAVPSDWPPMVPLPPALPAGQSLEGLYGKSLHNKDVEGKSYHAHPHAFAPSSTTVADWSHPDPDPGEGLAHTATQMAGGAMSGFVEDYAAKNPKADLEHIMGSYAPAHLPVLGTLAQQFLVFDHWHCAVPSETYCNRSFFHASTSNGYVENAPVDKWKNNTHATIFDRLQDAPGKPGWNVYLEQGGEYPQGLTGFIHPGTSARNPGNFLPYGRFFTDIAKGALPAYSFIECLYGGKYDFHPPQDVRGGEEVLRQVYEAIRTSAGTSHDYSQNTLLLVIFDEHGGCYDHVKPPTGVPAPTKPATPGEKGFDFTNLGLRVPAIAISAHTPAGTVVNTPMHHAAVIRTLCAKYNLDPLTDRDRDPGGGDLRAAVTLATPRAASTWPAFPDKVAPGPA
ncbi:MAG: alkaline phosphatase family protein [Burkholderiales bacterium]